mgnify:FL=1
MVIAIDFDGTCVTHEFPVVGKDIGAVPVLKRMAKSGHQLILYTMRSDRPIGGDTGDPSISDVTGMFLTDAVNWFKEHDIPLYGIQSNPTQHHWTTSPKVYAEIYIDDAALGCPLIHPQGGRPFVDWVEVEKILEKDGILKPIDECRHYGREVRVEFVKNLDGTGEPVTYIYCLDCGNKL